MYKGSLSKEKKRGSLSKEKKRGSLSKEKVHGTIGMGGEFLWVSDDAALCCLVSAVKAKYCATSFFECGPPYTLSLSVFLLQSFLIHCLRVGRDEVEVLGRM
jgi:hypothetical protein